MTQQVPLLNVLVIAYYFPPLGLSGVQRTLKFVRYLPQFGWQPTVLTTTPTGYFAQDPSLLHDLQGLSIEIVRAGSLDPNSLFRKKGVVKMPSEGWRRILAFLSDSIFIPDNKIGWKRKAIKAAEDVCSRKSFDIIFATAPPFTDLLIGQHLSRKFNIPLVLDYRDPWLDNPYKNYPTPIHRSLHITLEKNALNTSARVITTNRRVKELILQRYKFLTHDDVVILPQGYDPADFEFYVPPREAEKNRKFRITHSGVFYGDRTPKFFLRALRRVFELDPETRGNIEAVFVGNFHEQHAKLVRSLGLEDSVTVTGYLEHVASIQQILTSDVLWLMLENDTQSPGKLYEYIGARKPILASVPDGFIRQTVLETGAGFITDPHDVEAIARTILDLYKLQRAGQFPTPKEEIVQKYDRIGLTRELSRIFGFLLEP